jgi:predicted phage terminase large subunit-like protein
LPTLIPKSQAEELTQEALLRIAARKRKKEEREYDRELGATYEEAAAKLALFRADLAAYGQYVHNLSPARHHAYWIELYRQLFARELPNGKNKLLILAPPNAAKSTWTSIILPPFYLGNNPTHSILFLTSSDTMAAQFGTTIRMTLSDNKAHRSIFPEDEMRPSVKRGWSGDGLYLKGVPLSAKDPSYRAVGYGASVVGSRANLIILDDPLDQAKSMSEIEQRKAKEYYDMTLERRLQPDGSIIAIMTRWHENDLASHFLNRADWHIVIMPMICPEEGPNRPPDVLGRQPGELLWPERFPLDEVEKVRRDLGTATFNCVYQIDPTGMGGDVFKDSKWFKDLPPDLDRDQLYIVQGWDLAFSDKDSACYTACVTLGVDRHNQLYVLDVFRGKFTPQETEDAIVNRIEFFRPWVTGIEEAAFKTAVTKNLIRRVLGRVWSPVKLVKPIGDKVSRARLPAARAEAGLVFADKTAPWWEPFLAECLGFPKTTYKDQVDAFSLATHMIIEEPPERPKKIIINPYSSRTRGLNRMVNL